MEILLDFAGTSFMLVPRLISWKMPPEQHFNEFKNTFRSIIQILIL